MTQDEKYTEQFKKALNEYIELGFNQDECNGFMHGFHKGAEAKQLILSGAMLSVIYLVTNENKMTVESAHWKLEDAKKEAGNWVKHQPQFTFMVVETEIH